MTRSASEAESGTRTLWVAFGLIFLLFWIPLLGGEARLLGFSGGEIYGHAWVQWWHAEALWGWPSGTDLAVGTESWPVVDPLYTLLTAMMGRWLGFSLAWNAGIFAGVALTFWGGAFLARRAGGVPLIGGVGLALSPIFLGSMASGLTEDAALGLVAFAMGLLIYPKAATDRIWGGVLLGLTAWMGLVLSFLAAWIMLVCGLHAMLKRESVREWLLAGVLALLVALPAFWLFGERILGEGHRSGVARMPDFEALWRINPVRVGDLASFWAPGGSAFPEDGIFRLHPTYLGWVLLVCSLRSGRSAWWLLWILALLFSCGPEFRIAGHATGVVNPVYAVLSALPLAGELNHLARVSLIAQLALVVLAARGAKKIAFSKTILAGGLLCEWVLWGPGLLPFPMTKASVDPIFEEASGIEGAILVLPASGPGIHPQKALYEQRAHARKLILRPNVPGPVMGLEKTETGAWLYDLGITGSQNPPDVADVSAFWDRGVGAFLVREKWVPEVEKVLGKAHIEAQGGAIWRLNDLNFSTRRLP